MTDSKIVKDSERKKPPAAGMGRPKGALNKTTQSAKDAIAQAAEELGGAARLVDWVKEDPSNERVFWGTIYPKLLPLQVNGAGENGEHLIKGITITLVSPDGT
jgi:hypothetical protein